MRALLLAALVALPGCLGAPEEPAAPEADTVDAASQPPANAEPAQVASESPPTEATETPTERITPVAWDGATSSAVCPVVTCQIVEEGSQSWMPFGELGVTGRATRVAGTLTWTPETPLTQEMRVFVFGLEGEQEPPVSGVEVRGHSPLAFDVDLAQMDGASFAFSIHGHHEAGPVIVEKGQPFHVDAEIRSLA